MTSKTKRWLSILLALALTFGAMQFGVLAADAEQEEFAELAINGEEGPADAETAGANEGEPDAEGALLDEEDADPDQQSEVQATDDDLLESSIYYRFTDDWNVSYNATNVESSANGTYQVGTDTSETWYVGEQYTLLSVEAALDLIGVADTSFLDDDDYYYGYALHWYQSSPSIQLGGIANLIILPGEEIELTHTQMRLTITRGRQYLVSFDTDGGSEVESIRVKSYARINPDNVATPTRGEEEFFAGWYKDAELSEAWDFDTDIVTEDITLYAKWTDDDDGDDGDDDDDNGNSGGNGGGSGGGSSPNNSGNNGGQAGSGDSGSVSTTRISDPEVPLATPPTVNEILDDEVPLGALPKTGGSRRGIGLVGGAVMLAGSLIGMRGLRGIRNQETED